MKLKIDEYEYVFDLDSINEYIICENISKFNSIIKSFIDHDEERFLIVDNSYNMNDCFPKFLLIIDYYNLDIEATKNISDYIKKNKNYFMTEEYKEEESKLSTAIIDYLNYIKVEFPIDIKYNDNFNIDYLLKSYSVVFESNSDRVLRLIDYSVLQSYIYQKNFIAFVNINNYYNVKDIITIRSELHNKGIKTIAISSNDYLLKDKKDIIKIYLDKDLCEFYSK